MIRVRTIGGVALGVLLAVAVAISFMVFAARITCPAAPEECIGTAASDRMTADGGGSIMYGLAGNDILSGGGSADEIIGGPGRDRITTGAGNDSVQADDPDQPAGNDYINASGGGTNTLDGGDGNNFILGGAGADTVTAGDGNNRISTAGGNDMITVGDGNNYIDAGAGDDDIITGDGNNTINVGGGDDEVVAGAGDDIIRVAVSAGGESGDNIQAGGGDDVIFIVGTQGGVGNSITTIVSCGDGDDVVRATTMSTNFRGTFAGPLVLLGTTAGTPDTFVIDEDCETIIVR
jgi:Ca2+-binding RTX toxin-like protein